MMKHFSFLTGLGLLLGVWSCSPKVQQGTSSPSSTSGVDSKEMTIDSKELNPEFALETYLRRTPGVVMRGSGVNATVSIRGVNSFSQNTQPLFIVNGTDVGQNYSRAANLVRGMQIKSVRVLKGSDASLYGVRGGGGVIIITAK